MSNNIPLPPGSNAIQMTILFFGVGQTGPSLVQMLHCLLHLLEAERDSVSLISGCDGVLAGVVVSGMLPSLNASGVLPFHASVECSDRLPILCVYLTNAKVVWVIGTWAGYCYYYLIHKNVMVSVLLQIWKTLLHCQR